MNERREIRRYREIAPDYAYDGSIFSDEPERLHRLKDIIANRLPAPDRIIITLYADCQSTRALGRRFGLSHTTVRKEVNRIKRNILKMYKDQDYEHLR